MSHSSVLVAIDRGWDIEEAVAEQMAPFDENGTWFGDGTRWDWWQIGGRYSGRLLGQDKITRGEVDLARMRDDEVARYTTNYERYLADENKKDSKLIYGIAEGTTLEAYLASKVQTGFPWFGAFLRNKVWQEQERMGWWATPIKTECEMAGADTHIRVHENPEAGSRIASWGSSASWDKMFYARFVEPLHPNTLLVCVDYHV